ncbi:MAG: hypothetical protein RLN86_12885 [Cyclobacteriaceae bacterium]
MLVLVISLLLFQNSWSQTVPPLERIVSISFQNEGVDLALSKLSKEANCTFSYSPSILDANQRITSTHTGESVREILNSFFAETIEAKAKGNYVILTKAPPPPKKAIAVNRATISGYVFDEQSSEKIGEASVYDKRTLSAVVTDSYGFFKIFIDNPTEQTTLSFSKRGFLDTLISVEPGSTQFINVGLRPEVIETPTIAQVIDSVQVSPSQDFTPTQIAVTEAPAKEKKTIKEFFAASIFSSDIFSKKKGGVNVKNIRDTIYRNYQVSFVPYVGTNHKLSGNVVNTYSFNVLGGYSMGTSMLEVGGLFNIDRGDVKQAQLAGLFNTVGGRTRGVQMAGLGNLTKREVDGGQFAGLFNANLDSISGGQFAGLFNANGRGAKGAQFAGLFNTNFGKLQGVQFAGLFNVNGRSGEGAQLAGLFNVQPGTFKGAQVAGLINTSVGQLHGAQVSGLINFADNVEGTQLGFVNFADSIKGVPIGFLSFVAKGYHKIEVSADEIFYVNAAFRTGVRQFYNIFTAGLNPQPVDGPVTPPMLSPEKQLIWSVGYGVGTAPRISNRLSLNFDVTANQVNQGGFTESISLLSKLYVGLDFHITKKFSITAGATLNGYLYDPDFAENPQLFKNYSPNIIRTHTFDNGDILNMWWGGKIGLRFL